MGYGQIVNKLLSGVGGAVAGGLNAGTQSDLHDAILAAYGSLPNAPDYQHLFNQGWQAQNAMTPAQVYQDFKLKSMYAPEEQQQAFNLYQQYAPQYAAQNLKTLNKVDPQYLSGYRQLGSALSSDLASSSQLNPQQLGLANSYIDSAQAARGNVLGNANVAGNALYDANQGQQLYQQRIANMAGYLQNGGPESHFANIGGNLGQAALGQGMQNLTAPGTEYYQLPTNWGDEYAKLGQMQWQGNEQNALYQAQAVEHAPPKVNPWIASLSAGFGALAGNAQSGALQGSSNPGGGGGSPYSFGGSNSGINDATGSYGGGAPTSYGGNNLNQPFGGGGGADMGFIG